ncbi:SulP family inorganic anion transporter [Catellatospora bangladeshensis]|uniref:MFS superfamily sulfate permease-like transporter n=2 Tax=Saccharothrix algeriensis TaxID=173560 RepID=A0ABS2S3S8_9PSEU|nr:MFS superfamily sulfate permease-like transporter [Saccharothrix algeriensis]
MTMQIKDPVSRSPGGASYWPDVGASLVVFLVALPLCVGVAVASGVPAELGIVTGIVGGIVVGLLPGSSLQVSGPAAGLTVLVADTVAAHGLAALGVIVLGSGLLQVLMGLLRLGRWFRAISPAVVQGMLAGIGLVLVISQLYPFAGREAPAGTAEKFAGLPGLVADAVTSPAGVGIGLLTLAITAVWNRSRLRVVPGVLVAVVVASAVGLLLPLRRIEVGPLADVVSVVDLSLADVGLIGAVVTFALVASAESLFSAAAVDRMHSGPRTRYDQELVAQGVGNTLCGVLGALPLTAVIVRSSANVAAGARTKASRVLHGIWLLLFVVALPGVLSFVPLAALAAILIQAGWKLLQPRQVIALVRTDRAESFVLLLTAVLIVTTDLLTGTLVGLLAAVVKTAWDVSRLSVTVTPDGQEHEHVTLRGNATFLRLPRLLEALEALPVTKHVRVDLSGLRHLDEACRQAIEHWAETHRTAGRTVDLIRPTSGRPVPG